MTRNETLLDLIAAALEEGEQAMLCTVVDLDGSGYGRPGAKLVLTSDGRKAGFVSGGCLERELARLAWPATTDSPATLTFDTRGNPTQPGGRYNAGCEGCVHILCERIESLGDAAVDGLRPVSEPKRSAVVFASESPALPVGYRETAAFPHRLAAVFDGDAGCETCDLATREANVRVFVETNEPTSRVVIFGAGDDAIPLADLATRVGRQPVVVSHRPELLAVDRFPTATRKQLHAHEAVSELSLTHRDAVVLMTHCFNDDVELLPAVLRSAASYVGLLGPKRRTGRLMRSLHEIGRLPDEGSLDRLHTPIGLDIGATSPEEIAMAILGEIVASENDRAGGSLSERVGSIHGSHRRRTVQAADAVVGCG